ncbi:hypothetical protein GGX14DRAFT_553741 [Mycena pura]|uniref:Uncharacterized protein n=1 Tax=Mycena pura TaxID=153505 RepID=A0AAD7E6D8_9AGAR|nr:hypothetical protein GGX14DRAFT_553741 [Mycena pura]
MEALIARSRCAIRSLEVLRVDPNESAFIWARRLPTLTDITLEVSRWTPELLSTFCQAMTTLDGGGLLPELEGLTLRRRWRWVDGLSRIKTFALSLEGLDLEEYLMDGLPKAPGLEFVITPHAADQVALTHATRAAPRQHKPEPVGASSTTHRHPMSKHAERADSVTVDSGQREQTPQTATCLWMPPPRPRPQRPLHSMAAAPMPAVISDPAVPATASPGTSAATLAALLATALVGTEEGLFKTFDAVANSLSAQLSIHLSFLAIISTPPPRTRQFTAPIRSHPPCKGTTHTGICGARLSGSPCASASATVRRDIILRGKALSSGVYPVSVVPANCDIMLKSGM